MPDAPSELRTFAGRVADAVAHGGFPAFDPEAGETILAPDAAGVGYWVGAPSVLEDFVSGRVLMAYRLRRPRDRSPQERGYRVVLGASVDGGHTFAPIWAVAKEEVGTSSLERFCVRRGPEGDWLLYTSWEDPPASGRWRISVLRAPAPERFDITTARSVLAPDEVGVDAVKDPYVIAGEGTLRMYISTFLTPVGPAPTSLACSTDGMRFRWAGATLPVGTQGSWDGYQARISCVVPWRGGFVAYYDGAASPADDTEEHAGIACSLDLERWARASVDGPGLVSPHATRSLRYIDAVEIAGVWWAYYEYARADGSHELRRNRLDMR